ncbi:TKT [Symbiodinium natans]|uniref:TKT protein n=1 Tax=Symbiodinium natans TaxID=878477 RepID=A0A812JIM6_9DINO|nr:TKT [Symbiodinium natans]
MLWSSSRPLAAHLDTEIEQSNFFVTQQVGNALREVCILDAFFRACPEKFVPTFFDEAGHRVAVQYLFAVLRKHMPAERLLHYRVGHSALPGHPELGLTSGVEFSSGRLGHLWGHVNGVARAEPGRIVCCFSSDGSQMEGNTAEAARLAVAQKLNVKLFVDDNDTTISGHPSSYLSGFDVGRTLRGHGLSSEDVDGEDIDRIYQAMRKAVVEDGPFAVVLKRNMCPGVSGLEGSTDGHDAMPAIHAVDYLGSRGYDKAVEMLKNVPKTCDPHQNFWGCGKFGAPRQVFGETVVRVLGHLGSDDERRSSVLVVDSDLEGSCGLKKVRETYPEVYLKGGVMERGNFSACAGFAFRGKRQAVFGTFAAFQEMILSEVTMARLNHCNVLCHFSHSGVDDMSDNTCHFGLNNFFADNGLQSETCHDTHLFFPADVHQTAKLVEAVFWKEGLRFIYTTRSKVPDILNEEGHPFYGDYTLKLGTDDIVLGGESCDGYIVSYGDGLYRSLDAVQRLRNLGVNIGLVNKWHVNAVDERVMSIIGRSNFVLVVESQNIRTGLGLRMGTALLERNLTPRFGRCGTHRDGCCGTWEHAYHQGYDTSSITEKVIELGNLHPEMEGKIKTNINTPLYENHRQRAVARPLCPMGTAS